MIHRTTKVVKTKSIKIDVPTEIEKPVTKFGRYSAHVILPNTWLGKNVRIILLD